MLKLSQEIELKAKATDIRLLYSKYSGMLLGYISQIIDDKSQAEAQMISIFCELAKANIKAVDQSSIENIYCWNDLRRFALNHLPEKSNYEHHSKNIPSLKLNEFQQKVFDIAYYQKKSLSAIATQLNQPEESIRKTLKEAFAVMKGKREN